MWIEKRGQQHRVYWRTKNPTGPKKAFEPFATPEQAELFIELARASNLYSALDFVRDPCPDKLNRILGRVTPAQTQVPSAAPETAGGPAPVPVDRTDPRLTGVTFEQVLEQFIVSQRHVSEAMATAYEQYGRDHFLPYFRGVDIGLIKRQRPLKPGDDTGVVYLADAWLDAMLKKPKLNNRRQPRPDTHLGIKTIRNILDALAQVFDFAVEDRSVEFDVNPARGIRLPKHDHREMHFLQDAAAYLALRNAIGDHFGPLLDFLVGTGARYGEAAGLLVRNVHLDTERPYVDIRLALKWRGKKWKLGRPKTRSSIRRILLSTRLVEILRPLVADRGADDPVFTMIEGGPMHHGNFYKRYFKKAVETAGKAVPGGFRIHDLRHTHAAWLLSAGVSIYLVARRLGHSSTSTTSDIYGHLTTEAMDGVLEVVDQHLPDVVDLETARKKAEQVRLTAVEKQLPEFDIDDWDDLAA
jgi:integrase